MKPIRFSSTSSSAHPLEGGSSCSREGSRHVISAASPLTLAVAPALVLALVSALRVAESTYLWAQNSSFISSGNLLLWQLEDFLVSDVLRGCLNTLQKFFASAPLAVSLSSAWVRLVLLVFAPWGLWLKC